MTTKSTNANGLGPSKFRKDAAIFSPNNYNASSMNYHSPHPVNANKSSSDGGNDAMSGQMHNMNPQFNPQMMQMPQFNPQMMQMPQFNPQMMQMQMANPQMMQMHMANPQMMQMNMAAGMNMGMGMNMNMNPTDMYNTYNPYMTQPQYEFNPYLSPMQFGQPNYPYMPVSPMYNNGLLNMPPKNGKRKHYKSTSTTPRSYSFKSNDESPSTTEITEQWDSDKQAEASKEQDSSDHTHEESESTPELQDKIASVETPEDEYSGVLKNLPLYINTDFDDFNDYKFFIQKRKEFFDINKAKLEDRDLIIKSNEQEIISYDTPRSNTDNSSTLNGSVSIKPNWASVLTSSVKGAKPKKGSHQQSPSQSQIQSPTQIQSNSPVLNTAATIKTVEEIDSVGLLSLKTMFGLLNDASLNNAHFRVSSRGLTNTGNICYMNSILQVMMYCEPFNNLFKILDLKSVGSLNTSKASLVDATIALFKDFSQNSSKSLSPENFYMKLINNSKFSHLKWGQQEDAEEFLGYLLDGLHEEFIKCINEISKEQLEVLLNKINPVDTETRLRVKNAIKIIKKIHSADKGLNGETKLNNNDANNNNNFDDIDDETSNEPDNEGWNEIGSKNQKVSSKRTVEIEPSPIKTIFGGQFRSVLQVPNKKDQSITLDPFQCIQLDISNEEVNTIEDAFKQLNEPELIPFKLNDNREVMAKKQTFIDNLPPVLIIHLKRFSYHHLNNGNIEKLKKKISYGHHLTIPSELFSSWRKHINRDYKLTAVVYHHGIGAEGGHYTCDVLRTRKVSNIKMNNKDDGNDNGNMDDDYDDNDNNNNNNTLNEGMNGGVNTADDNNNQWIRIDDTIINEIDKQEVLNGDDDIKNAYILFYQQL